jgi:hypothetical protein
MSSQTRWIIPEAKEPRTAGYASDAARKPASIVANKRVRIALFDNNKANAAALLGLLAERIASEFPEAEVLHRGKHNAAVGAPATVLDQVAEEADWAITAMAD